MRERPPGPPDPPIIPGHMGWPGREKLDALVEEAVSAFCDRTKVPIEERLVQAARDTAGAVSALLGEAYSQGVRDGWTEMLDTPAPDALVDGPEVEVGVLRAQWDALTSVGVAEAAARGVHEAARRAEWAFPSDGPSWDESSERARSVAGELATAAITAAIEAAQTTKERSDG